MIDAKPKLGKWEMFPPGSMAEFHTNSSEETRLLGELIGKSLLEMGGVPPLVLTGPLGAGKTELARGIATGMGAASAVSSPTFSLVQEYRTAGPPLFHLDFFRLEREDEVWGLGWEDLPDSGICIVEWGEKFPMVFPGGTWRCIVSILPEGKRRLVFGVLDEQNSVSSMR